MPQQWLRVWPDFSLSKNQAKKYLRDLCELERLKGPGERFFYRTISVAKDLRHQ